MVVRCTSNMNDMIPSRPGALKCRERLPGPRRRHWRHPVRASLVIRLCSTSHVIDEAGRGGCDADVVPGRVITAETSGGAGAGPGPWPAIREGMSATLERHDTCSIPDIRGNSKYKHARPIAVSRVRSDLYQYLGLPSRCHACQACCKPC